MPRNLIALFLFFIFLVPFAGAQELGIGRAGVSGDVVSYMEIMAEGIFSLKSKRHLPCYTSKVSTIETGEIQMLCYTRLDGNGNLLWEKWTRPVYEEYSITYEATLPLLEKVARVLMSDDDYEYYFFYYKEMDRYPIYAVKADTEGNAVRVFILKPAHEDKHKLVIYDIECEDIFTTHYTYEGGKLISISRDTAEGTVWTQTYGYSKTGTLISSVSIEADGTVSNRSLYTKGGRIKKMTIYPHTDGEPTGEYSYKYSYKGSGSAYTSTMKMHRGDHPYYSIFTYRAVDGLTVSQSSIVGHNEIIKSGNRKRKNYDNFTKSSLSFRYNRHGDYTAIIDQAGGSSDTEVSYLYDEEGNWYYRATAAGTGASVSMRAFNYVDK